MSPCMGPLPECYVIGGAGAGEAAAHEVLAQTHTLEKGNLVYIEEEVQVVAPLKLLEDQRTKPTIS